MLHEALSLLPDAVRTLPPSTLVAIASTGFVLAIAGGRLSRSLITLAGVGVGTLLGLHAPAWLGIKLDGIGAAFCGAIVIGAGAFLLHRFWIGILFASLLSSVAGGVTWFLKTGEAAWHVPTLDLQQPLTTVLAQIWSSLPAGLYPALPIAIAIGSGTGMLLSVLFPKSTRLMFYSLLGTIAMIPSSVLAIQQLAPQWLSRIPTNPWIELAIVAGIVLLAFGIQWMLAPRKPRQPRANKFADMDAEDDDPRPLIAQSFSPPHLRIDAQRPETAARRTRAMAA